MTPFLDFISIYTFFLSLEMTYALVLDPSLFFSYFFGLIYINSINIVDGIGRKGVRTLHTRKPLSFLRSRERKKNKENSRNDEGIYKYSNNINCNQIIQCMSGPAVWYILLFPEWFFFLTMPGLLLPSYFRVIFTSIIDAFWHPEKKSKKNIRVLIYL